MSTFDLVATGGAFLGFLAVATVHIHSERSYRRRMAEIRRMAEAIQK